MLTKCINYTVQYYILNTSVPSTFYIFLFLEFERNVFLYLSIFLYCSAHVSSLILNLLSITGFLSLEIFLFSM